MQGWTRWPAILMWGIIRVYGNLNATLEPNKMGLDMVGSETRRASTATGRRVSEGSEDEGGALEAPLRCGSGEAYRPASGAFFLSPMRLSVPAINFVIFAR